MLNFITNSGADNLKKRLVELISKSEQLKFLVGFFYFSGITELYSSLKNRKDNFKLRVLVGLEVDNLISGMIVEYSNIKDKKEIGKREIENNFINSVKKSLNSDDFDQKEFYEQVYFFIDLIIKDKLIIRKTKKPNHAKLYIFSLDESQIGAKNLFITGSSNLTKAGLSYQHEFNVEIKDYGTEETDEYFENLWEDSVLITENKILKDKLIETIENETQVKKITPFQAFVIVLKTYIDTKSPDDNNLFLKEVIEDAGYRHYRYQEDAIKQAIKVLNLYNGVIIADVVGLGKSIIAAAVAKANKKRGIILCPPGIIADWKNYLSDFGLSTWRVLSSGNINLAEEFIKKEKADPIEVVIIDEAHKFRNSDTPRYEKLKNICRNRQAILVSATPFNNSPLDILSLLELFIIPKKSSLTLGGDLKNSFKNFKIEFEKLLEIRKFYKHSDPKKVAKARSSYKSIFDDDEIDIKNVKLKTKELAIKIRSVIEPVIIRRNRLDLQKNSRYKEEVKNLSDVELLKPWYYELSEKQSEFYDTIIEDYFGEDGKFTGAIYSPFVYESGKREGKDLNLEENRQFYSQKNTIMFMRRFLVKRLESSFNSFEKSIENQISTTEKILKFINNNQKYILDRKLIEKIAESEEEDVEEALFDFAIKLEKNNFPKNNKIYDLNNGFKEKDKFILDINSDLMMYKEIKERLFELEMVKNDPKSRAIIKKIKERLKKNPDLDEPQRKIIIFTEYRDTANFLALMLKEAFGDRVLYSSNLGSKKIKEINRNFDASYSKEDREDKYDILLATDKISEGFNLNRAGMVINYDIPWNPVRVIQRVGRINRISKKVFEKLYIVNFFPTEKGAELVQTEKIAAGKMFMIHNVLGEDAKIFHLDEEPTPSKLFNKFNQDPDDEEESFETKIINQFRRIKKQYPELIIEINNYPSKIKVSKIFKEKSLLVFTKKERLHVQEITGEGEGKNVEEISLESIYKKIYCDDPELKGIELSNKFWNFYSEAKNFKERTFSTGSQQSIEVKARNFLNFIISNSKDLELKTMAEILLEDMTDYGTLILPTMRKIVKIEGLEGDKDKIKEFNNIFNDLGGIGYLDNVKRSIKNTKKEIIVAIENQ